MNLFKEKNIAIFGATGHIAKNLIYYFSKNTEDKLFLFSRNHKKSENFISNLISDKNIVCDTYENIFSHHFDVIINCIGISNPSEISKYKNEILPLSKKYDDLIIEYLKKNNSSQYLNLSSGAVFGDFSQPVNDASLFKQSINDSFINSYSLAKIYSETNHRLLHSLNIIDIRIFNFFSRFINLNTDFLIPEIIRSINKNEEFITNKQNFFRDFIHPEDLFKLINLCIKNPKLNIAFDTYSTSPISKYSILEEFSNYFDLTYSFKDDLKIEQPTGFKKNYFSLSRKANNIGYFPTFSSLETLLEESKFLIET
jgi:nucleoside-diphosphate-sugar epimerase